MKTLEFLSKYLGSPIIAHRQESILTLFNEANSNPEALKQLGLNLRSSDYDVVFNSLKILLGIAVRNPERIIGFGPGLVALARKTDHFGIANMSKEVLLNISSVDSRLDSSIELVITRLTPKIKINNDTEHFYTQCDYSLEYSLGNKDFKYQLSRICDAFRYECKKASKKVFTSMRKLGYKKGKSYRQSNPSRWREDYDGYRYQTKLFYYSQHSIQIFLMWCVENLNISSEAWKQLLLDERTWDPSIPEFLIEEQPEIVGNLDLITDVDKWLKQKIKKEDVYKLLTSRLGWTPLYEVTNFKEGEKSFDRFVATAGIKGSSSKLSKKIDLAIPSYACSNCFLNELPMEARRKGALSISDYNHSNSLEGAFVPNYGIVSSDYGTFTKLFPSPEIVEHLKLRQKKNTLEYYKGKELVIRSLNWRSGYDRDVDHRGEDRYELANYGHILLIKTKYLKKYLEENNLKFIAIGNIAKRKVKKWGGTFDYGSKNSRLKRASFEIIKLF